MNRLAYFTLAAIPIMAGGWLATCSAQEGTIILQSQTTYQTMTGWEATAQEGHLEHRNKWLAYKDTLHQQVVNDLGINRVRLEVVATPAGFDFNNQFTSFDQTLVDVVVPLRQLLAARGETLWVNVCVVGNALKDNPTLYGQQVLLTFQRMQANHGFTPDSWEVTLEPDVFSWDNSTKVANAMVAAGQQLQAAGFPHKIFVAPSNTSITNARDWFDQMKTNVPAVMNYISEISYHTYGTYDNGQRAQIGDRALANNLGALHGERIGATYIDLHNDLKFARVSAWAQYTIAWVASDGTDDGGKYYIADDISNPNNPPLIMGARTKFLRQYFKFIRRGAVRIDAVSNNTTFDPVAFRNTDGTQVVVVKASAGGTFSIQGLPGGSYGIKYTTTSQYDANAPSVTISSGQTVTTSIPAAGVLTVYGTSPTNPSPTPTPTPTPTPSPSPSEITISSAAVPSSRVCAPVSLARAHGALGPEGIPLAFGTPDPLTGRFPTKLSGIQVLVDSVPAEILTLVNDISLGGSKFVDFVIPEVTRVDNSAFLRILRDDLNGNPLIVGEGRAEIRSTAPALWTLNAIGGGAGLSHTTMTLLADDPSGLGYPVVDNSVLGSGSYMRISLYGTGLRGAFNSDPTNELPGLINVAESYVCRAHLSDGREFPLPLEYVGAQGRLPGLDMVVIRLTDDVQGSGNVAITLTETSTGRVTNAGYSLVIRVQ